MAVVREAAKNGVDTTDDVEAMRSELAENAGDDYGKPENYLARWVALNAAKGTAQDGDLVARMYARYAADVNFPPGPLGEMVRAIASRTFLAGFNEGLRAGGFMFAATDEEEMTLAKEIFTLVRKEVDELFTFVEENDKMGQTQGEA